MSTQIFITLPVVDLPRALAFYEAIGYSRNVEVTNNTAACLVISEHIHLMLLTHAKFGEFSPKAICDTSKALQVLHSLTSESRTAASCITTALSIPMVTARGSIT